MRSQRLCAAFVLLVTPAALAAGCTSGGAEGRASAPASASRAASSTTGDPASGSTTPAPSLASTSGTAAAARLTYRSGLALPDRTATPGSALAGVGRAQICTRNWTINHDNIPVVVQNAVGDRYGVVAGEGTSLRFDQLIPSSLGGDVTARNVWPQPKTQARRKNLLEIRLHQLVCAGELPLSSAQDVMTQDWTAGARKYPPA